jgi:7-cyano-7-deazaguanine synthase
MKKEIAIVAMSGGMDSALTTAIALNSGYDVAGLHLNYGQRTQAREEKAFNDICDYYNIKKRLVVDIGYLVKIGGSSLTDTKLKIEEANLGRQEIPSTYVPFRNANILAIATSWAEVLGAKAIYIGAMQLDSSGYPDCREVFFQAFQKAIEYGTKPETEIKVITPIINFTKKDIVLKSVEFKAPLHLTWSCYSSSDVACGVCDSCVLRLRGFEQAGIPDPIIYKQRRID